jgi:hypothetical protein
MADIQVPSWLEASRFVNAAERNRAVSDELDRLFESRVDVENKTASALNEEMQSILADLVGPLEADPPSSSQAAEAALTLATFSVVEGRVLNLLDPQGGDLTDKMRVAGDRGAGDRLCSHILGPRNIPATRGPLQSSSFRAGYLSPQVRRGSLGQYVVWQSAPGRTIEEVRTMAVALVDAFLLRASSMPPLPALVASRFTYTAYRQVRDRLLATGSGGALEQYLLAGMLNEELSASQSGLRVETKNVGANDAASGAAGDIEIRHGQALRGVIEVTAATWVDKLDQLPAVAAAHLSEAVIAAPGVGDVLGDDLSERVAAVSDHLGLDVAVVDLHALMDVAAARITKAGRAEAFRFVYRCVARYHRRQPELAERLIAALKNLGLTSEDVPVDMHESTTDMDSMVTAIRELLTSMDIAFSPNTPAALRQLAASLEAAVENAEVAESAH